MYKAKYVYPGDIDVVNWGSNDDPKDYLVEGQEYEIEELEVHSYHTKVYLTEFPGKKFNSVHFEIDDDYFEFCRGQWRQENYV
jgi:hypothetical protein